MEKDEGRGRAIQPTMQYVALLRWRKGAEESALATPRRMSQAGLSAGATLPKTLRSSVEPDFNSLIQRASSNSAAADDLFARLYHELHRLAEYNLRRAVSTITLDTTSLLHEAYLNMSGRKDVAFTDEVRFLAYASRAMRGLVIDYARRRRALKRGRHLEITLAGDELPPESVRQAEELEQLGDAIEELARLDPALAELVDLHFFCGFSFIEIAELRGSSERTVQRDWRKARLLLQRSLTNMDEGADA